MEWLNKIRTKVESALDYAWYVGERWGKIHDRYYGQMCGDFVLWNFWLWIVLLPFIIPLLGHNLPEVVAIVMSICLIFLPYLFCLFRYTKKRRKALLPKIPPHGEHQKSPRKAGRALHHTGDSRFPPLLLSWTL